MLNSIKSKLLLIPFFLGLLLMLLSWYLSYPIPANSAGDFVFNHISILYWFSLPLLLVTMFLMALIAKSNLLKWVLSVGIVLVFFSLFYFYYLAPGPDSEYFRGMIEYFIQTRSLDPSQINHGYYQWPTLFILSDIVTTISGISLASYEFLLFSLIGFFLTTAMYVYASNEHKMAGFLTVIAFFISVNLFIDYQAVPYSLALSFLFILFILERQPKTPVLLTTMIILYAALLITHLFVPLFFVMYLFLRSIFEIKNKSKRKNYMIFFFTTFLTYLTYQFTVARFSIEQILQNITKTPTEYNYILSTTVATVISPIDVVAQFFSRTVTIGVIGLCGIGFIILLFKKKMTSFDKSIFFTGIIYSVFGTIFNTLGFRGLAVAFIPVSLGAAFLFKFRLNILNFKSNRCFASIFLILISLAVFIPIHQSFNTEIQFHTESTYISNNFFIDNYNWENPGTVISDFRTNTYLVSKLTNYVNIETEFEVGDNVNALLYSPEFSGTIIGNYTNVENLANGEGLNLVYSDGSSYLLIRPAYP